MDLLWLIIVLAAVLILEEVIFKTIIIKLKHKNTHKNVKTNAIATPMLAGSVAYMSQVASIVTLSVAIVAVIILNVVRLVGRTKNQQAEGDDEDGDLAIFNGDNIFRKIDSNDEEREYAYAGAGVTKVASKVISPVAKHQSALFMSDYHGSNYVDNSSSHASHIHSTMSNVASDHIKHHFSHEIIITDDFGDVTEIVKSYNKKTGLAQIVKIKRSFKAKLIQSSDETKSFYGSLKNELLSYKKAKSHINWNCDEIDVGGITIAKFVVRCKTICIYLALDPDEFIDSKYKVVRTGNEKFKDVPCMYCVKNDRREQRAKELIALVAAKYGLVKNNDTAKTDYYMPYESTDALTAKGLIKEVTEQENYEEFMRKKNCSNVFSDGGEDEI